MKEAFLGRIELYGPEETVGKPKQADEPKCYQTEANPALVDIQDFTRIEALNLETFALTISNRRLRQFRINSRKKSRSLTHCSKK